MILILVNVLHVHPFVLYAHWLLEQLGDEHPILHICDGESLHQLALSTLFVINNKMLNILKPKCLNILLFY